MNFLENINRKKLQTTLIVIISVLAVIALALLLVIIIASVSDGISEGLGDTELKEYNVTEKDLATGSLILADEDHPYTPNEEWLDLRGCQAYRNEQLAAAGIELIKTNYNYIPYKDMKLSLPAMAAAHNMLTAAKEATGERPVTIDGAYGYFANGEDRVEYKSGLTLFISDYDSESGAYVALSDAYRVWLEQNAASYGFVESFEDGYRYVGLPHAKYMTDKKLSLADYINYLKENTDCDRALKINCADGEYMVYKYDCAKAGDVIKVPVNAEYTLSGTNDGVVIVTYKVK